jgi:hypothetical protein
LQGRTSPSTLRPSRCLLSPPRPTSREQPTRLRFDREGGSRGRARSLTRAYISTRAPAHAHTRKKRRRKKLFFRRATPGGANTPLPKSGGLEIGCASGPHRGPDRACNDPALIRRRRRRRERGPRTCEISKQTNRRGHAGGEGERSSCVGPKSDAEGVASRRSSFRVSRSIVVDRRVCEGPEVIILSRRSKSDAEGVATRRRRK